MADTRKEMSEGLSEGEAMLAFSRSTIAMVLTDPSEPDNPIVYVNRAFERMTGYSAAAAVGRNCRFLQGPDTDQEKIAALRRAIEREREVSVDLLNYRADGTPFMNRLRVAPVQDETGRSVYMLGIQMEISSDLEPVPTTIVNERPLQELQHRVKNHLAMIVGLVRLQGRGDKTTSNFDTLARRIESLQLLYEELSSPALGERGRIALGAYLGRVCSAIAHLDGRAGVRVNVDVASIYVSTEAALRLGLILSEVLTNAFQHAFVGRNEGLVEVRVMRLDRGGIRMQVSDDGVGMDPGAVWPDNRSLGGRIVMGLIEGLDGKLDVLRHSTGTVVNLEVPPAEVELKQ